MDLTVGVLTTLDSIDELPQPHYIYLIKAFGRVVVATPVGAPRIDFQIKESPSHYLYLAANH